jgi:hypothetical protein
MCAGEKVRKTCKAWLNGGNIGRGLAAGLPGFAVIAELKIM